MFRSPIKSRSAPSSPIPPTRNTPPKTNPSPQKTTSKAKENATSVLNTLLKALDPVVLTNIILSHPDLKSSLKDILTQEEQPESEPESPTHSRSNSVVSQYSLRSRDIDNASEASYTTVHRSRKTKSQVPTFSSVVSKPPSTSQRPSQQAPSTSRTQSGYPPLPQPQTAQTTTPNNTPPQPPQAVFNLRNIPQHLSNQKTLYKMLNTIELFNNQITLLKVNLNRTALLKTTKLSISSDQLERTLRSFTDMGPLQVISFKNDRPRTAQTMQNRPQQYSFVIRGVDTSITESDVRSILEEHNFPCSLLQRIVAKADNLPTRFIRVNTPSEKHYHYALSNGIKMFGMAYQTEPSIQGRNPIPVTIKYCAKCTKTGHSADDCRARPVCPTCGGEHKSTQCPRLEAPKCNNCQGPHPTFSPRCPARQQPPKTTQETTPITIERPIPPFELSSDLQTAIIFNATLLFNLLPGQRRQIIDLLQMQCPIFFGQNCHVSGQGNKARISFHPIPPYH